MKLLMLQKKKLVATVMEENIETKEVKNYTIKLGTYFKNDTDNGDIKKYCSY